MSSTANEKWQVPKQWYPTYTVAQSITLSETHDVSRFCDNVSPYDLPLYSNVIISAMASQITGVWIVCSIACSNKISRLRVTGLCEGNPAMTGGFPSQRASNVENIFIWWRCHERFVISCFLHVLPSWTGPDRLYFRFYLVFVVSVNIR